MVKRSPVRPLRDILDEADINSLDRFTAKITEYRRSGKGAITTAKSIVNSVYEGVLDIPNISVAIHKHGPVPVYILPGSHALTLYGREIQARIGIYQDILGDSTSEYLWPSVIGDKHQFLLSLSIARHLRIIFSRYFEDVGELFFDIEHHLNFPEVVRAAFEIEAILSESVNRKLNLILNHRGYPPDSAEIARQLLADYPDVILTAQYARIWALFALNHLYRILGLKDYADEYRAKLEKLKEDFDQAHTDGAFQEFAGETPEIADLEAALQRFWTGDAGGYRVEESSDWIHRFLGFARFVGFLRTEQVTPHQARIFLSSQHDVPVPEKVRKITEDFLLARYNANLKPLIVDENIAGVLFKDKIRSRIWLSDSVLAIAPRNQGVAVNQVKDLSWIAREVDHGLGLSKRVVLFMEEGTDQSSVLTQFTRSDLEYLSPKARRPERVDELRRFLEDFTVAKFGAEENDWIMSLQKRVDEEARLILEIHFQHFFWTALSFFSRREIQALQLIHEKYSKSPRTKKQLAPLVFRGRKGPKAPTPEREFDNFRRRVRGRRLVIDGVAYELVVKVAGNCYKSQLQEIAQKLRRDVHPKVLESWILRLLDPERQIRKLPEYSRDHGQS